MRRLAARAAARVVALASVLAAIAASVSAVAQTAYPTRPIRILVPFTVGGTADVLARALGQRLAESWGQQVVVENRGGAGGTIAMDAFRRMAADGYSFALISNSQAVSHVVYSKLTFDIARDFVPVSVVASSPMIIAAHPRVPARSLGELLESVARQPGRLSYGSCGVGTAMHVAMEAVKFRTRTFIVHVPYRGCSVAAADILSGQIDLVVASSPALLPLMQAGKVQALAVTNDRRTPSAPAVPTVAESGVEALRGFAVDNWYGFLAPQGTPREPIERFAAETRKILSEPDFQRRIAAAGIDVKLGGPDELAKLLDSDIREFRKIVEFASIKPE
jgi:tripartite-type tricarboxylate transporter receptor subunit TctC